MAMFSLGAYLGLWFRVQFEMIFGGFGGYFLGSKVVYLGFSEKMILFQENFGRE